MQLLQFLGQPSYPMKSMNIRSKTLVIVAIALIVSALTNFFVIHLSVFPKFIQLEREAAKKDGQRAVEALTSEIENIQFTLWDYSNWDETYTFVQGGNANYAEVISR